MGNKITVISDASYCQYTNTAAYCYRLGLDGEYITGRGTFKEITPDLTKLETWAQELALTHLLSWFTIPRGSILQMRLDHQGARHNAQRGVKTGIALHKIMKHMRGMGIEVHLNPINGVEANTQHDICHREANRIRKLKSK